MKIRNPLIVIFSLMGLFSAQAQEPLRSFYPNQDFIDNSTNYDWGRDNQNINHPSGVHWQEVKRATAIIQAGNGFCSATLMNNVKQDGRLIISTAAHCIRNSAGSEVGLLISFNYEMSDALDRGEEERDINITRAYDLVGTVRLKDDVHDIALIELNDDGQNEWSYHAYSTGYNAVVGSLVKANISHPSQDHKKIFIDPKEQSFSWRKISNQTGKINTGYFHEANEGWGGIQTSPLKGSSGSGFYNRQQELIGIVSKGATEPPSLASAISNSLYRDGSDGLQTWLDPDQTWVNKVPGGYLHDLIPSTTDFVLELNSGESLSTPGLASGDETRLDDDVLYLRPSLIFDDLINQSFGLEDWEHILGIKIPNPNASKVVLTVHSLLFDPANQRYNQYLLYGSFANNASPIRAPLTLGFREEAWDCDNLSEGFPPCDRPANFILNEFIDNSSTNIKHSIVGTAIDQAVRNKTLRYILDKLPVIIKLTNIGGSSVEVQALSYPGDVPRNVLELFKPIELAGHFKSRKYRDNKGIESDLLHLKSLTVSQGEYSKTIQTGDNGGYLNLVNPNFKIGPIKTLESGNSVTFTSKVHNPTAQPYTYKVWIDYFNTQQLDGVEIDHTYNFVLDPVSHQMERVAVRRHVSGSQFSFTVDMPSFSDLNLAAGQSRWTRLRVELSDKNNEPPEQVDVQNIPDQSHRGETEDYLIEIKAPTQAEVCELERPSDYEAYAQGEVMPYCGAGGFSEAKTSLIGSYQQDDTGITQTNSGNMNFAVGKKENVAFATAWGKHYSFYGKQHNIAVWRPSSTLQTLRKGITPRINESKAIGENDDFLSNHQLFMDVYYPKAQDGIPVANLEKLPVLIWAFGGGFMIHEDPTVSENICRWLASQGYVVAAIDYRLGINLSNGELSKRALMRAWQDMQAAVKYWRFEDSDLSTANGTYDNDGQKWNTDPSKIYGLGWSSGGITVLNNMYLNETDYQSLKQPGAILASASEDYAFTIPEHTITDVIPAAKDFYSSTTSASIVTFAEYLIGAALAPEVAAAIEGLVVVDQVKALYNAVTEESTYQTYALDAYPTLPCIGANKDCITGYTPTSTYQSLIDGLDGRVDKGLSFAGAIADVSWMDTETSRPVANIQYEGDLTVNYNDGIPFENAYLSEFKNLYNVVYETSLDDPALPSLSGGGSMKTHAGDRLNNYHLLNLSGADQGGSGNHKAMLKFGATSGSELEPKLMYYVDAFFTKEWSAGSGARLAETAASNEENTSEEKEGHTFNIFPNPASDHVNILVEVGEEGPLKLRIVDLQGRQVYEMERDFVYTGHQLITLRNLDLPAASYVLVVEVSGVVRREKLLIE